MPRHRPIRRPSPPGLDDANGVDVANSFIKTTNPTLYFQWPDGDDAESGISGYQIVLQQWNETNPRPWIYSPQVGVVNTYTLNTSGLLSGQEYKYWIRATNGDGVPATSFRLGGTFWVDDSAPTVSAVTVSDQIWQADGGHTYDMTVTASDDGSGIKRLNALINYQGSNSANPRSRIIWDEVGYVYSADQVPCSGGGFASKTPDQFQPRDPNPGGLYLHQ